MKGWLAKNLNAISKINLRARSRESQIIHAEDNIGIMAQNTEEKNDEFCFLNANIWPVGNTEKRGNRCSWLVAHADCFSFQRGSSSLMAGFWLPFQVWTLSFCFALRFLPVDNAVSFQYAFIPSAHLPAPLTQLLRLSSHVPFFRKLLSSILYLTQWLLPGAVLPSREYLVMPGDFSATYAVTEGVTILASRM